MLLLKLIKNLTKLRAGKSQRIDSKISKKRRNKQFKNFNKLRSKLIKISQKKKINLIINGTSSVSASRRKITIRRTNCGLSFKKMELKIWHLSRLELNNFTKKVSIKKALLIMKLSRMLWKNLKSLRQT